MICVKSQTISELSNLLKNSSFVQLNSFVIYDFREVFDFDKIKIFDSNLKSSKRIIINYYKEINQNNFLFILCFNESIIIISQSLLQHLNQLLNNNCNLPIYFLSDIKYIFNFYISLQIQNQQIICDQIFLIEIEHFCNYINTKIKVNISIKELWNAIKASTAGYLIKKSYDKTKFNQYVIIMNYFQKKAYNINSTKNWRKEQYITLRQLGYGSTFYTELIYNIEREELFVLKKLIKNYTENSELIEREINNYNNINYPFLPKIYGITTCNGYKGQIIQFINGHTLENIEHRFNFEEKIVIIFQIMKIFDYLHKNNFVYRDLKPDNVIIDENKIIFIIDFDNMIRITNSTDKKIHTTDFSSVFVAPEVNIGHPSYKSDIYSLGQMIYYIINEKYPNFLKNSMIKINPLIQEYYKICTEDDIEKRPSISMLMRSFYNSFKSSVRNPLFNMNDDEFFIQMSNCNKNIRSQHFNLSDLPNDINNEKFNKIITNVGECIKNNRDQVIFDLSFHAVQNDSNAQYLLGTIYEFGEYTKRDIKKAIYYYTLAAEKNHTEAQYTLGTFYDFGEYTKRDINKAIYYYTLAAKKNHISSQFNLGSIYSQGDSVKRDIRKAIYYYSLAANQNHVKSQVNLGNIYSRGDYIHVDIDKAIYYYSLAAKQNDPKALFFLGYIYYNNRDMDKSIYYMNLAAKQNMPDAQHFLGEIYLTGYHVPRDINKSIYYYTLAAKNNIVNACINLGLIYYNNVNIKPDIKKSIYYFTIAAKQNNPEALYNIGVIYNEGKLIEKDIDKATYYFTLAANQKFPRALFNLGCFFFNGEFGKRDINKAIYFYSLAAKQNHSLAQFNLGLIYTTGFYVEKQMIKGIDFFIQSSKNNNHFASFKVGYFYHEGKYIDRDIKKSIHYYKDASSFRNQYAKNNLGIIYKNGIDDIIPKNIEYAFIYFNEAIRFSNDAISMYNLAHMYIYEYETEDKIKDAIELLIKSIDNNCFPSILLLCISLIKMYGYDPIKIKNEFVGKKYKSSELFYYIDKLIIIFGLNNDDVFRRKFEYVKTLDYMYDFLGIPIISKLIFQEKNEKIKNINQIDIDEDFYRGFGL